MYNNKELNKAADALDLENLEKEFMQLHAKRWAEFIDQQCKNGVIGLQQSSKWRHSPPQLKKRNN